MKLYNTLTQQLEPFVPLAPSNVRMFVCGPTVYGPMHIGHAKTYTQFDLIARVIKQTYPKLRYAMNITDLDDKIINRAAEEAADPMLIARHWEGQFWRSMKILGNTAVTEVYRAHDHIEEIIGQVERLLSLGKAYEIPAQGIYFDLAKFPEHGRLARRQQDERHTQSRLVGEIDKRNSGDFVLWKFPQHDSDPSWEAPFGRGRPGWHIEDTAITEKHLGESYDIHGGATDLIFPHHEAEIAQMEAATGKPLVNYWLHTGLLSVDGKKMGKSLKNFVTVDEMLERVSWRALRFAFLSNHYRSTMETSDVVLAQAETTLERVENYYRNHAPAGPKTNVSQEFLAHMQEDFNAPAAFAAFFDAVKMKEATRGDIEWLNDLLGDVFQLVAIPPASVVALAEKRQAARKAKYWQQSDAIREEIATTGWQVRDTAEGFVLEPLA